MGMVLRLVALVVGLGLGAVGAHLAVVPALNASLAGPQQADCPQHPVLEEQLKQAEALAAP